MCIENSAKIDMQLWLSPEHVFKRKFGKKILKSLYRIYIPAKEMSYKILFPIINLETFNKVPFSQKQNNGLFLKDQGSK